MTSASPRLCYTSLTGHELDLTWLPHILKRQHAQESARNPLAARQARRHEHRQAWLGIGLGLLFGGIGLASAGLMFGTL